MSTNRENFILTRDDRYKNVYSLGIIVTKDIGDTSLFEFEKVREHFWQSYTIFLSFKELFSLEVPNLSLRELYVRVYPKK